MHACHTFYIWKRIHTCQIIGILSVGSFFYDSSCGTNAETFVKKNDLRYIYSCNTNTIYVMYSRIYHSPQPFKHNLH